MWAVAKNERRAPVYPGLGVDASGAPVVDPTQNVLDLVAAAIQRQDDLRESESRHVMEIARLRSEYQAEIRTLETARINAIRAVDAQAVQQAATVAETRASALAAQVAASAEAMRNQVAAAAQAAQLALTQALGPINEAIADLRRAQYEAQGQKAQVVETRSGAASVIALASLIIGAVGIIVGALIATR
jgi:hypothetical protein